MLLLRNPVFKYKNQPKFLGIRKKKDVSRIISWQIILQNFFSQTDYSVSAKLSLELTVLSLVWELNKRISSSHSYLFKDCTRDSFPGRCNLNCEKKWQDVGCSIFHVSNLDSDELKKKYRERKITCNVLHAYSINEIIFKTSVYYFGTLRENTCQDSLIKRKKKRKGVCNIAMEATQWSINRWMDGDVVYTHTQWNSIQL